MSFDKQDQEAVTAIRALSMAMISHAKSGHPGLPLDAAPMAYVLFKRHLHINPKDPDWIDRDRFVLSAGHGSAMLYALLHLSGYDLTMADLKSFRSLGSRTPGHPELGTPGVDAATGPLGQGFGMAVGLAMAEKHLAALYNKPEHEILNNRIYVLASDGDLMEGISHESASLAGHLKLNNLVVLYDSNNVTLDANADKALSDNAGERFTAYGWNYLRVADGNDLDAIDQALNVAEDETDRPTLIEVKTELGYGSPYAGSHLIHGNPLDTTDLQETMTTLGWSHQPFDIPQTVYDRFSEIGVAGAVQEEKWHHRLAAYQDVYPELAQSFKANFGNHVHPEFSSADYQIGDTEAIRDTVHKLLQETSKTALNFWGGSADLSSSNKTFFENDSGFEPGAYEKKNIFYGVREFAEAAAANGITLYGGSRTFASTFFVFSDYMRSAIRMAALQNIPTIFAYSHDSISLGQDGPTHQPIEQLDSLRAMPNLTVLRPGDPVEATVAWNYIINHLHGPVVLAMSRQALPVLAGSKKHAAEGVPRGAYVISSAKGSIPDGILMASGSEVSLAIAVQQSLADHGQDVSVVSVPSMELFEHQAQSYKDTVLPPTIRNRMSIELGAALAWGRYVGLDGITAGLNHFGDSGVVEDLMKKYGFTVNNLTHQYLDTYAKTSINA